MTPPAAPSEFNDVTITVRMHMGTKVWRFDGESLTGMLQHEKNIEIVRIDADRNVVVQVTA